MIWRDHVFNYGQKSATRVTKGLGSECKARETECDLGETWHSSSGICPEPLYQVSPKSHF